MGFLAWIIVGLIAGWLAGQVMKGGGYGMIVDIILGLLGAVLGGWIFGLSHAPNVLGIDKPRDRERYLGLAVPLLVMDGMLLGGVYHANRYSLAPTVAMHFWYDLAVSMVDFATNPRQSMISSKVSIPF